MWEEAADKNLHDVDADSYLSARVFVDEQRRLKHRLRQKDSEELYGENDKTKKEKKTEWGRASEWAGHNLKSSSMLSTARIATAALLPVTSRVAAAHRERLQLAMLVAMRLTGLR
jgi:hypothetical protein